MANVTLGNVAVTATLVGSTADTVTPNAPVPCAVEVMNLDTAAMIWARADGSAATVAGVDCIPIPANSAYFFTGINSVSLISSGTPQYTVDRVV